MLGKSARQDFGDCGVGCGALSHGHIHFDYADTTLPCDDNHNDVHIPLHLPQQIGATQAIVHEIAALMPRMLTYPATLLPSPTSSRKLRT